MSALPERTILKQFWKNSLILALHSSLSMRLHSETFENSLGNVIKETYSHKWFEAAQCSIAGEFFWGLFGIPKPNNCEERKFLLWWWQQKASSLSSHCDHGFSFIHLKLATLATLVCRSDQHHHVDPAHYTVKGGKSNAGGHNSSQVSIVFAQTVNETPISCALTRSVKQHVNVATAI